MANWVNYNMDGSEKEFDENCEAIQQWFRNDPKPKPLLLRPGVDIIPAYRGIATGPEFYDLFTTDESEPYNYEGPFEKIWVGSLLGATYNLDRRSDFKVKGGKGEPTALERIKSFNKGYAKGRGVDIPYEFPPKDRNLIQLFIIAYYPFGWDSGYKFNENPYGVDMVCGFDVLGNLYVKSQVDGIWRDCYEFLINYDYEETEFAQRGVIEHMDIKRGPMDFARSALVNRGFDYVKNEDGTVNKSSQVLNENALICKYKGRNDTAYKRSGPPPFDEDEGREFILYDCLKQKNLPHPLTLYSEFLYLYNPTTLEMCGLINLIGEMFIMWPDKIPENNKTAPEKGTAKGKEYIVMGSDYQFTGEKKLMGGPTARVKNDFVSVKDAMEKQERIRVSEVEHYIKTDEAYRRAEEERKKTEAERQKIIRDKMEKEAKKRADEERTKKQFESEKKKRDAEIENMSREESAYQEAKSADKAKADADKAKADAEYKALYYDARGRFRKTGVKGPRKKKGEPEPIKMTISEVVAKPTADEKAEKRRIYRAERRARLKAEKTKAEAPPPTPAEKPLTEKQLERIQRIKAKKTAETASRSTKIEGNEGTATPEKLAKVSDMTAVKRIADRLIGDKYKGDVPLEISTRKGFKYMLLLPGTRKRVHFGDLEREDFTKHKDEKRKDAFKARNKKWENAEWNTPAWLSYHLLW